MTGAQLLRELRATLEAAGHHKDLDARELGPERRRHAA